MKASDHRKAIPVGVKLHAALLLLGFSDEEISGGVEWDHDPALALRLVDQETGQLMPHPNDPHHLRPLRKADHAVKTRGAGATTAGSDVGNAAKLKRLERDRRGGEEYRRRLLAKAEGEPPPETKKRKYQWPTGRKIQNRKGK